MANCIGTNFPEFVCVLMQMQHRVGENSCGQCSEWWEAGGGGPIKGQNWQERLEVGKIWKVDTQTFF